MTNPTGPYGGPQGPQNPYGQPQPGANPYGQPQPAANPYGQPQPAANPYGQPQPGANPYGQPQPAANPYGQPQQAVQAPPQPGPNPYAQPQPQPQPGTNPYGQQQPGANPYGQPQSGANGYGQPQPGPNPFGAPQNPYNQAAPAGPLGVNAQGTADDQSLLTRLGLSKIRAVGLVVGLIVAGGFGIYHYVEGKSDPKEAKVGDCLTVDENAGSSRAIAKSAKKIACTDATANYKVIGRIDDSSDTDKCKTVAGWKDDDAALYQESLSTKNKSYVLCLEPTK